MCKWLLVHHRRDAALALFRSLVPCLDDDAKKTFLREEHLAPMRSEMQALLAATKAAAPAPGEEGPGPPKEESHR